MLATCGMPDGHISVPWLSQDPPTFCKRWCLVGIFIAAVKQSLILFPVVVLVVVFVVVLIVVLVVVLVVVSPEVLLLPVFPIPILPVFVPTISKASHNPIKRRKRHTKSAEKNGVFNQHFRLYDTSYCFRHNLSPPSCRRYYISRTCRTSGPCHICRTSLAPCRTCRKARRKICGKKMDYCQISPPNREGT